MHSGVNCRVSGVGCQETILTRKPDTWIYSVFVSPLDPRHPPLVFLFTAATQCRRLGCLESQPGKTLRCS